VDGRVLSLQPAQEGEEGGAMGWVGGSPPSPLQLGQEGEEGGVVGWVGGSPPLPLASRLAIEPGISPG
jgi:hypothetical protein